MRATTLGLSLLLALSGCECADDEPSFGAPPPRVPSAEPATPAVEAPRALVPATRTGLPAALPSITIALDGEAYTVGNAALLGSWPPSERARLAQAPPAGAGASWPELEVRGEIGGPGLAVPVLTDALRGALAVERARSASGAPTAVALRVTPETPWSSVARAVYAAGMAGLSEPRFVLASGREEVELRVPLPALDGATRTPASGGPRLPGPMAGQDPTEVAEAIRRALEAHPRDTTTREEVTVGTTAGGDALSGERGSTAEAPVFVVRLGRAGLVLTRGAERLGAGCQRPAIGAEPSLPSAGLGPETLRDCLASAGASRRPYVFEAEPEVSFSRAAPVLEILDEVGSVTIAASPLPGGDAHE
jgi:hypothetical protein